VTAELWDQVGALVDRARGLDELRVHRLHLFAASRWRAAGRPVPRALEAEEWLAAARLVTAPVVLGHIRAAYDGPLILMKGLEVADAYGDPVLRPFADIDLLVPDADAVQQALVARGFEPIGDSEAFVGKYHRAPLVFPGLALPIEIHQTPKWVDGVPAPAGELFSLAVQSRAAPQGVLALPRPHHAMILAAHSWAHEPLRRALDLVDIAALIRDVERSELRAVARAYGLSRVWRVTEAAMDSLLGGAAPPFALRVWARNLLDLRERTVLEAHLTRWLSPFWSLPLGRAAGSFASTMVGDLRPGAQESWREKALRTRTAIRNASVARSEHERDLEIAARTRSSETL